MTENVGSIEYYIDANTRGLLRAEKQVDQSTRRMEGEFDKTTAASQRLERGLSSLSKVAAGVITSIAIAQIVSYADAFTNVQNRLAVVTDSTEQLADVTQKLADIARASRSNFEATATLYSRTARATEEMGISQERLLGITDTITKSFTLSGATADEAANAITQLSQGLASGALRGEEFNSVSEQAPEILRAVAQETGKTIGELRTFASEGGITSELLIKSLENYADVVDREFAKTNATFSQSAEVARTNAIEFVGSSELISSTVSAAGSAIVALSENLDVLQDVLLAGAAVLAGRYAGGLFTATAASVKHRAATVATAKAELDAAKAASQRALSDQAAAQRSLMVARNDTLRGQALTRLAAANQTVAATTNAMTAAQARYNAVAAIGTRVANGLRGAMALLGGPAGLIFLAASALVYFASTADDASDRSAELTAEIDALTQSFKGMTEAQRNATMRRMSQESKQLTGELEEATQKYRDLQSRAGDRGVSAGMIESQRREVERLQNALNAVQAKMQEAFAVGIDEVDWEKPSEGAEKANEELTKLTQTINDQIYAIQNGQQAYEIMIAQRKAGVDASSEEGKEIARLIQLRDIEADRTKAQAETEEEATRAKESAIDSYDRLVESYQSGMMAMQDTETQREQFINDLYEQGIEAGKTKAQIDQLAQGYRDMWAAQDENAEAKQTTQQFNQVVSTTGDENMSPEERLIAERESRLAIIDQYAQLEIAKAQEVVDARIAVENAYQTKLQNLEAQRQMTLLGSTANIFDSMSGIAKAYAGEQSGIYKGLFALSKAFSIAQSIIAIQTGIAQAAALPFPANIPAMATVAAQTAGIVSTIQGANMGGGRLYGGGVNAGTLYPITENGRPEILTQGNKQYLLPGDRGRVTSNKDMGGMTSNNTSNINLSLNVTADTPENFSRQIVQNQDLIYNTVKRALNDKGKTF